MGILYYFYYLSIFSLLLIWAFRFFNNYFILRYGFFYDLHILFITLTFYLFIYKFIVSDWSINLILYNTHELDFLIYRVLALWSNNEGALFLLC